LCNNCFSSRLRYFGSHVWLRLTTCNKRICMYVCSIGKQSGESVQSVQDKSTHTHAHNRLTVLVQDYPGGPVPEETFTHSHPSSSPDILYELPPSTTIHGILPVQFMCLAVLFHKLSLGPLWSSSWSETLCFILHTSI